MTSDTRVFYLEDESGNLYWRGDYPWSTTVEDQAWFVSWALNNVDSPVSSGWAVKAFHREDDPYEFKIIGQRDAPWGDDVLGYSGSPYTIGSWGCVVVSAAMMLAQVTHEFVSPSLVNERMKAVKGYSGHASFLFGKLENAFPDTVHFAAFKETLLTPAPVRDIKDYTDRGDFAICQVDFRPTTSAVDTHYLLITEVSDDLQKAKAADPWTGRLVEIPYAYFNPNWSPKNFGRAVMRTAFYKRV